MKSQSSYFMKNVDEGHQVENYDTWHIFYDYDKEDADMDVELEQKHDGDSSSMNTSNSKDSRSSGEDTQQVEEY